MQRACGARSFPWGFVVHVGSNCASAGILLERSDDEGRKTSCADALVGVGLVSIPPVVAGVAGTAGAAAVAVLCAGAGSSAFEGLEVLRVAGWMLKTS